MIKVFNQKKLYFIILIFFAFLILRVVFSYYKMQNYMNDFARKESEVLSKYVEVHRNYYQELYLNNIIHLDKSTLLGLPAYATAKINQEFENNNISNFKIKVVSDRVRNVLNKADIYELKAINFFRENPDKDKYFDNSNSDFYQYAKVLKINKNCLICHGEKKNAPTLIQKRYKNAYGYKLNDIRGIISVRIPKDYVENYFMKYFIHSTLFDIILFISLLSVVYYIINKTRNINEYLEKEVKEKTYELKKTFLYDKLTNLPNRTSLIEKIQSSEGSKYRFLAILNIDDFKDINDFYGHSVGDDILVKISKRLVLFCDDNNVCIYKLSGDEFAIFSTQKLILEEFVNSIYKIIDDIQETKFFIGKNAVFIRVSCGISFGKGNILVEADMALKEAKNKTTSLVVYHNALNTTKLISKNIDTIHMLKNAIDNNNIIPFFQPILNVNTNKIEKYESLVRIVFGDNVITPDKFLEIAIKSKLYPNITKNIILKSFEIFKNKDSEISINISIEDILNDDTRKFILKLLDEYPSSDKVVFEILENEKIKNYDELNSFIKEIKKRGSKVAIDDFGSGYSNFSHILSLDIDYLKIDASLVKNILTDNNSYKITQTIIFFAKSLKIKTIAEFVDSKEALEELKKMGVDFVQGYFIGKPREITA